jgi:hypothetical protein
MNTHPSVYQAISSFEAPVPTVEESHIMMLASLSIQSLRQIYGSVGSGVLADKTDPFFSHAL